MAYFFKFDEFFENYCSFKNKTEIHKFFLVFVESSLNGKIIDLTLKILTAIKLLEIFQS